MNQLKRRSYECSKQQVNESESEYLGFLCVLLQCVWQREREEGVGRKVGMEEKKNKWDASDKQYEQQ